VNEFPEWFNFTEEDLADFREELDAAMALNFQQLKLKYAINGAIRNWIQSDEGKMAMEDYRRHCEGWNG
jgi:uncharacterized glyoxalase superfamily metalloenzyme YdcJ